MKKLISRKQRPARNLSRRGFGLNRRFGLNMEALEQRAMLAVTAVEDTYVVDEGQSFNTGSIVTEVVSLGSMWTHFQGVARAAPNNVYPDQNQLPTDWNDVTYDTGTPSFGTWQAPAPAPFHVNNVGNLTGGTSLDVNFTDTNGGNATLVTALFRTNFTAAAGVTDIRGTSLCDDSCAVYVNGVQVYVTPNLPNPLLADSEATGTRSETVFDTWSANLATAGITLTPDNNNVLAIELHQHNTGSSDIGFDASLSLEAPGGQPGLANNDDLGGAASALVYYADFVDPNPNTTAALTGLVFNADTVEDPNLSPVGEVTITPATGEFVYTPRNQTFNGQGVFQYVLVNAADTNDFSTALATININSVNVAPTGTADTYLGVEGQSFTIDDPGAAAQYISQGETWFYKDDGSDQSAAMTTPGFDAEANGWFRGPAQLGYGDGDETMLLNQPAGNPATYFAKSFDIPGGVIPNNIRIGIQRDDGALIFINGQEVVRDNVDAGIVVTNTTLATGNTSSETQLFEHIIPTAGLNLQETGNIITVSVHQQAVDSSDISFNLFLEAATPPMLNSGDVWFYLDDGSDQSAAIADPGFDPVTAGWASGPSQLGYGDGDEATIIGFGPDANNKFTTSYYARRFDLTTSVPSTLLLELVRDDAAIVRINGVEVVRDNMSAGPVDNTTFAAADANADGLGESGFRQHFIGTAGLNLQQTDNLITVEVHQVNLTSSDASFDLRLQVRDRVGLLANDPRDADGDAISVAAGSIDTTLLTINNTAGAPALGTVSVNADGTFEFTAIAGRAGSGSFTYQVTDGTDTSAPVTVTISLASVDSGPVTAVNDTFTTAEDTDLVVTATSHPPVGNGIGPGLLANDTTDPDDQFDPVSIVIVTQPANGTVTLGGLSGEFTYTPNANYNGPDSFQYQADDGFMPSNTATVNITVTSVDDPPTAAADSYFVVQGQTLNVTALAPTVHVARGSSWSYFDQLFNGKETNPNGTPQPYPTNWNQAGFDDSSWPVGNALFAGPIDGLGPLGVTFLDGIDDAALPAGENAVTTYLFRTEFTVANPAGIDALITETLADDGYVLYVNGVEVDRYLIDAGPVTTTTLANANGDENLYVQRRVDVTGLLVAGANTVAVELHQVADTSSDAGFDMSILGYPGAGVIANDTDPEGDAISNAVVTTQPTDGSVTLNADGTFSYTPTLATFTGADTFQYTVMSGGLTSLPGTVTITVSPLDRLPTANNDVYPVDVDGFVDANTPALGVLGNDDSPDGPAVVVVDPAVAANGNTVDFIVDGNLVGQLIWAGVTVDGDGDNVNNGTFVFFALNGFSGQLNYVYEIKDPDGDLDTATVTFNIGSTGVTFDLDSDGDIDNGDLAIIVGNYGATGATNLEGDVTGDGNVNVRDVVAMRNRLGSPPPSPAAAVVSRVDARAVDQAITRLEAVRDRLAGREAVPRLQARARDIVRERVADARSHAGEAIDSVLSKLQARRSATRARLASVADQLFDS